MDATSPCRRELFSDFSSRIVISPGGLFYAPNADRDPAGAVHAIAALAPVVASIRMHQKTIGQRSAKFYAEAPIPRAMTRAGRKHLIAADFSTESASEVTKIAHARVSANAINATSRADDALRPKRRAR